MVTTASLLQGFEAARDVEALMERMRQLQENLLRDEGASQEEMESRFELEKSESLLVTPSGTGSQAARCRACPLLPPSLLESWYPQDLHFCCHLFQNVLSLSSGVRHRLGSWPVSLSGTVTTEKLLALSGSQSPPM